MKVKFLKDFRGKQTKEAFHKIGAIVELGDNEAQSLIKLGFAEIVKEQEEPKPKVKSK